MTTPAKEGLGCVYGALSMMVIIILLGVIVIMVGEDLGQPIVVDTTVPVCQPPD